LLVNLKICVLTCLLPLLINPGMFILDSYLADFAMAGARQIMIALLSPRALLAVDRLRLLERRLSCCKYFQDFFIQSVLSTRDFTSFIP